MVSRLKVIFFLSVGLVFGQIHGIAQRTDTVYQTLFTNVATFSNSTNVTNIGQIGHQAVMMFSNAPSHTCVTPQSTATAGALQFSYDNANWASFGFQTNATSNPTSPLVFFGTGAYPFVRFSIAGFDNTNCRASVFYSGTLNNISTAVQGATIEGTGPNYYYPNVIGGFSGDGLNGSSHAFNNSVTLPLCQNSLFGSQLVGGPTALGTAFVVPTGINTRIHVCQIVVTSVGSGTVQFTFGNGICSSGVVTVTPAFHFATGVPLVLGGNIGSVIDISAGTNLVLCGTVTGATIEYYVTYALGSSK